MNADRDLHQACQEWRRLAEAEGEAIRAGNWLVVHDCQNALRDLQPRLSELNLQARQEWSRQGCEQEKDKNLLTVIHSLIELERRNYTWLNVRREAARAHLDQLEQAGRDLKRIRHSYAPAQHATWSSFS